MLSAALPDATLGYDSRRRSFLLPSRATGPTLRGSRFAAMPAFTPLPLGQRIPPSLHAVSVSLPTMRAVRGYEEKDPAITRHMASGYPRFVVHPCLARLQQHYASALRPAGRTLWLTASANCAAELAAWLGAGSGAARFASDGLHGVTHPEDSELFSRAKAFLQHIGGFLSSREAEDRLVRLGLRPAAEPEELFAGDAVAEIKRVLRPAFAPADDAHLLLANSGMNALYAAFRALAERQAARGRTLWVQLGWLYLDTIALLKKFTAAPGDYVYLRDAFDLAALERLFAENGARIAGLITEVPTNPLIQTPDVAAVAALARRHGAAVILDTSIASSFNLDVLAHADAVAVSLTKYTASEGDLIAGAVAVNPAAPGAADLRAGVARRLVPVYARDLARLAAQIGRTEEILARINANALRVAAWLQAHPGVKDVFWALHPASRANYLRVARHPGAVGGIISFTVKTPLDRFYDRLSLPKGPSFGMKNTLICPFMYLAHYDLVTTPAGRAELAASGLDTELLRLSVGAEPVEEIIAALAEALAPE